MRLIIVMIICCLVAGCGAKEKLPADILEREKMQAVMWDMMRADQFLSGYALGSDSTMNKDSFSIRTYQQVLALHNLSKEKFAKSFAYYKANPALMKQIMDTLSVAGSLAPTPKIIDAEGPPAGEERLVDPDSIPKPVGKRPVTPVN